MTPRMWLAAAIILGAVVALVTGRPRAVSEVEPIVEPEPGAESGPEPESAR